MLEAHSVRTRDNQLNFYLVTFDGNRELANAMFVAAFRGLERCSKESDEGTCCKAPVGLLDPKVPLSS